MSTTERPKINVELLDRTLAHIEANPDEWDQTDYRCRTGMCFAGWAAHLSGGVWIYEPDHFRADALEPEPDDREVDVEDGEIFAGDRAQRLLGLTDKEADWLFDAGNKIDDLRRKVASLKALAGGES